MKRIVVLGGGFAGLWSAVGAARKLDELQIGPDEIDVTLVERNPYHNIRVRNYEADLTDVIVDLGDVLDPIGVRHVHGDVELVDTSAQVVGIQTAEGPQQLSYDRLVFALGSRLVRPNVPGLAEYGFDVDTYAAACRLNDHIRQPGSLPDSPARNAAVVVGAGLTGIEVATELPEKLQRALGASPHVVLVDHAQAAGSDMGDHARPRIEEALRTLAIETRLGVSVTGIGREAVTLSSGERIPAGTTVWCAGMRAHPLATAVAASRDPLGRLLVDEYMRVRGLPTVFAAGDAACAEMAAGHPSVMSCQHGRPMGRFAGHNVVADLVGAPLLPLRIDWYVTVLDLGPAGALYTVGWDRQVVSTGVAAKETKQMINCRRIYPPRSRLRADILAAAAPVVQAPPEVLAQR